MALARGPRIGDAGGPVAANVEVAYVALSFFGARIIAGKRQTEPNPPFAPGGESRRRIVALGAWGGIGRAGGGAPAIACASSPEKTALALQHGAVERIDHCAADRRAQRSQIAPQGVDVVYDPIAGGRTEIGLRAFGCKGRLLTAGFAFRENPNPQFNPGLVKGCDIFGSNGLNSLSLSGNKIATTCHAYVIGQSWTS